jgi:Icc-related predicted phosphoesterase
MKLRITHISDTHNKHKQLNGKLPGGDLLIHSGDISSLGRQREVENFVKWFNKIEGYTNKVFIAGNHDMSFDSEKLMQDKINYFDPSKTVWESEGIENEPADGKPEWLTDLLATGLNPNVFYLENSFVEIDQIKIWGSPYSATFGYNWAFNVDRGYDSAMMWKGIPDDSDIVITHGPIYGYCDVTARTYENVGCQDLYHRMKELNVPLHFSGHIHEGYGYRPTVWGGYAFNGCTCDLSYDPVNKPITFDYNFSTKELIDFI